MWTSNFFCAPCEEWSDTATCHNCRGEATQQQLPRERERLEDDGRDYGHPGDVLAGRE